MYLHEDVLLAIRNDPEKIKEFVRIHNKAEEAALEEVSFLREYTENYCATNVDEDVGFEEAIEAADAASKAYYDYMKKIREAGK